MGKAKAKVSKGLYIHVLYVDIFVPSAGNVVCYYMETLLHYYFEHECTWGDFNY